MAPLWDDVKNAIVDGYVYASDKAEEMTQIGRAKVEILKLNRKIAQLSGQMGGRVFELYEKDEVDSIGDDETIRESVEKIRSYRREIATWEQEIEKAKAEREAGAAHASTSEPQANVAASGDGPADEPSTRIEN